MISLLAFTSILLIVAWTIAEASQDKDSRQRIAENEYRYIMYCITIMSDLSQSVWLENRIKYFESEYMSAMPRWKHMQLYNDMIERYVAKYQDLLDCERGLDEVNYILTAARM